MTFRKWILKATIIAILVAMVKYFIIAPIYDKAVNLSPLVMLGVGIIVVVILFKIFTTFGSFITIGMFVIVGIVLIVIGLSISGSAEDSSILTFVVWRCW